MEQGNNHKFVCGLTQSGKSYFVKRAVLEMKCPVLYFNVQGEALPEKFFFVSSSEVDLFGIRQLVEDKAKVNLLFETALTGYKFTAGYLLSNLMIMADALELSDKNYMYVVIDECHLLSGWGLEAAKYVATAGLKKGIRLICVTQRPALCDKTLYTQAFEHYMFRLSPAEGAYMRTKGIDFDECLDLWEQGGAYSYCYYNGYVLEGREPIS